jgi:hypothetical protein
MSNSSFRLRFWVITLITFLVAASRLLPHPPNFAPVGAIALFGTAYFDRKYFAFIIPLMSLWLSDLLLNNVLYAQYFDGFVFFYQGFYWNYLAFVFVGILGLFILRKPKPQNILIGSLSASILFFLISNFGVWASGVMYPKNFGGLITCYAAAIPFFRNTVLGDLFYCTLMFGVFELAKYKFPALKSA